MARKLELVRVKRMCDRIVFEVVGCAIAQQFAPPKGPMPNFQLLRFFTVLPCGAKVGFGTERPAVAFCRLAN